VRRRTPKASVNSWENVGDILMATERLSARFVSTVKTPGRYCDGRGLYLDIGNGSQRSWALRFMINGRSREMGLGSAHDISLAEAREKAAQLRKMKANGVDPLVAKHASKAAARAQEAKAMTFEQCAAAYVTAHRASWRSVKHAAQWQSSLAAYVFPLIGSVDVGLIATAHVLRCLEPIWTEKTVTASRVRGRIESVLNWATARGYRTSEPNPARWRGHLSNLLADPEAKNQEHHAALPHADLPAFMLKLRQHKDVESRALEFLILTCARTTEAIGADWAEIDVANAIWIVPASRMKAGVAHRVPLVPAAIALLGTPGKGRVFALSHRDALRRRLQKIVPDMTPHGFRSTFRVWASECTDAPHAAIERCLAHTIENKTARAYARSDLLDKRRDIMTQYAAFCTGSQNKR
jgi:integrase